MHAPGAAGPLKAVRAAAERPIAVAADYAKRIWSKAASDDLFFLGGGVAFDILLAGVPFFMLLASGLGYVLRTSEEVSISSVTELLARLLPSTAASGSLLDPVLHDVVRTRGSAGVFGAIAFLWFSTRLFASMRSVLVHVFDEPRRRNILLGKLFDVQATLLTTVFVVAWIGLSAYIALARTNSVRTLSALGLHEEGFMRPVVYVSGRVLAFSLLVAGFFLLYKLLPTRFVRWQQALIAGVTGALLFEIARFLFTWFTQHYNPASFYTGTLSTIIVVVFWVYYAALVFVFSGEVAQVHEVRLAEQLSRTAPWRAR